MIGQRSNSLDESELSKKIPEQDQEMNITS